MEDVFHADVFVARSVTGAEPPLPALHPQMRMVFAQKVRQLAAALQQADRALREASRDALRGFVERIEIPADPAALLTVRGVMGTMLAAATGRDGSAVAQLVNLGESVGCGGVQPAVLAPVERRGVKRCTAPREPLTRCAAW